MRNIDRLPFPHLVEELLNYNPMSKEKSKYYTPKIEEFHVGFRYQHENNWERPAKWEWRKYKMNATALPDIQYFIDHKEVRVKYLDRKDIEELGWKFHYDADSCVFYLKSNYSLCNYNKPQTWVSIWNNVEEKGVELGDQRFDGNCKNYNELKKVMQMLRI